MKKLATWLFIICLPCLLLTLTIAVLANSLWLYTGSAEKYGVADSMARAGLRLSDAEISDFYASLIHYYNSGQDYVYPTVERDGQQVDILTAEEIQHFKDVKGLIRLDYGVLAGTLVVCLAVTGLALFYWHDRRLLGRALLGGGIFTLGLLLVLLVLDQTFGFDNLFVQFHYMFFSNMFWSVPGNMLRLFPENLFTDAATMGFGAIGVMAAALGGGGWWWSRSKNETG